MLIDWRAALVFVTREPDWKPRIGLGGLLMLVVPPIGWVLALGYRSLVRNRLVDGCQPLLPPWRGHTVLAFGRGAKSVAVTLTYLSPFLIAYWTLGLTSNERARRAAPSAATGPDMTDSTFTIRLGQLERRLRLHQRITAGAVLIVAAVGAAAFQSKDTTARFTELTVERLNVVEPDGQLVLAIANRDRLPDPLIAGKTVETPRTGPGIIFFDGRGWEVGGLTYSTRETEGGYRASGHFAFDQYRNDQVVYLNYSDDGKRKNAGLYVVDRARTPAIDELLAMRGQALKASPEERKVIEEKMRATSAQRIFVGSDEETAMVRLRDRAGRDRIRMSVNPQGVAQLEFLDEAGKVIERLPK